MSEVSFEEKLQHIKEVVTTELPTCLIDQKVEVSLGHRWMTDKVCIRVTGYIWGEYRPDISVSYLPDWWQTFKETWFPEWLKRVCPVEYQKMVVHVKIVYPELRVAHPELDKMKCVGLTEISREMIEDITLPMIADLVTGDLFGYLKDFVWGEGQDSVTLNYPSDGWQVLKSRLLPDWLSVHYCEKTIFSAEEVPPQLKISFPEEPYRIILNRNRQDGDDETGW